MPCRSEKRVIHGRSYTVTQMPPTVSIPIHFKIVQITAALVGPMFKDAVSNASNPGQVISEALSHVVGSLSGVIAEHMPPDEFLAFAKKLTISDYVRVEGGPIDFESEFCGDDMVRLYLLLAFILEVNYAQFFSGLGLGKAVDLVKAKLQPSESSESPPT